VTQELLDLADWCLFKRRDQAFRLLEEHLRARSARS
jgi:hypothetical protein